MATEEEILRLLVETAGREKVDELRKAFDAEREAIAALDKTSQTYTADLATLEARQKQTAGALLDGQRALSGSTRNVGQAALEASRAMEDLQYGVGGVVNNIPGLVMSLGGTAGLTAVISLVSVAVNQLIKHWPEIMAYFGDTAPIDKATGSMQGLEAEVKKLEAKDVKLTVDLVALDEAKAKLDQMKKDIDAFNAALAGQTEAEAKSSKAMTEAFGDHIKAAQLFENLKAAREQQGTYTTPEEKIAAYDAQEALQAAQAKGEEEKKLTGGYIQRDTQKDIEAKQEAFDKLAREQQQAAEDRLKGEIGKAMKGDDRAQAGISESLGRAGGQSNEEIVEKLQGATAEQVKLWETVDRDTQEFVDAIEQEAKDADAELDGYFERFDAGNEEAKRRRLAREAKAKAAAQAAAQRAHAVEAGERFDDTLMGGGAEGGGGGGGGGGGAVGFGGGGMPGEAAGMPMGPAPGAFRPPPMTKADRTAAALARNREAKAARKRFLEAQKLRKAMAPGRRRGNTAKARSAHQRAAGPPGGLMPGESIDQLHQAVVPPVGQTVQLQGKMLDTMAGLTSDMAALQAKLQANDRKLAYIDSARKRGEIQRGNFFTSPISMG